MGIDLNIILPVVGSGLGLILLELIRHRLKRKQTSMETITSMIDHLPVLWTRIETLEQQHQTCQRDLSRLRDEFRAFKTKYEIENGRH